MHFRDKLKTFTFTHYRTLPYFTDTTVSRRVYQAGVEGLGGQQKPAGGDAPWELPLRPRWNTPSRYRAAQLLAAKVHRRSEYLTTRALYTLEKDTKRF